MQFHVQNGYEKEVVILVVYSVNTPLEPFLQ